jgi:myo-inositol-1(or 4)-monophosphatase
MTDYDLELRHRVACAVAREGGRLARSYFERRGQLEIEHKGMQDLVSIADRSVEELIRERLSTAFPDDALIGEEGGGADTEGAPGTWVIDPIDGTMNFLRGIPYWSLAIAYVRGKTTEIGITYDPIRDELFAARRGHGAFRDGLPIRISGASDPRQAVLGLTFSFKIEIGAYVRTLAALLESGCDHRRLGSTALMMCHVADGRLDGCISLLCHSWDVIGGLLLVREAGGIAPDYLDHASLLEPASVFGCTPGLRQLIERASGLRL